MAKRTYTLKNKFKIKMGTVNKFKLLLSIFKYRKKSRPLFAIIVVNSDCNGNCPHCFLKERNNEKIEISTDKYINLIDELVNLGCYHLDLHGGEILLREDLKELVSYAKKKNLFVQIVTNGTLIKNNVDKIEKADRITVSLDGSENFNDRMKNYKGHFQKASEGIEILSRMNKKISINAIIYKNSINEIEYLCKFARENNAGIQFLMNMNSKVYPTPDGKNLDLDELAKTIKKIIHFKKMGYAVLSSMFSLKKILEIIEIKRKENSILPFSFSKNVYTNFNCRAGFNYIIIDYNGYLYRCFHQQSNKANVFELGVLGAMRKIQGKYSCEFCINPPNIDQNGIYALQKKIIYEYFMQYFS